MFERQQIPCTSREVLFATRRPTGGSDAAARRWRWFGITLYDPYRLELPYMHGPLRLVRKASQGPFAAWERFCAIGYSCAVSRPYGLEAKRP